MKCKRVEKVLTMFSAISGSFDSIKSAIIAGSASL